MITNCLDIFQNPTQKIQQCIILINPLIFKEHSIKVISGYKVLKDVPKLLYHKKVHLKVVQYREVFGHKSQDF